MKIRLVYDGEVILEGEMSQKDISKLIKAGLVVFLPDDYKPSGEWKSSPFSPEIDWLYDYSLATWLRKSIVGSTAAVPEDWVPDSIVSGNEVIIGFSIP